MLLKAAHFALLAVLNSHGPRSIGISFFILNLYCYNLLAGVSKPSKALSNALLCYILPCMEFEGGVEDRGQML